MKYLPDAKDSCSDAPWSDDEKYDGLIHCGGWVPAQAMLWILKENEPLHFQESYSVLSKPNKKCSPNAKKEQLE